MARAHERMFDMMHHQMIREDGNRYRNSERNNSYRSESTGSRSLSVGHQRPRYHSQRNFVQDSRSFPAQAQQQQQQQHRSVGVRRQDTLAREGIKPLALSRPSKHSENRTLNRKLPSRGGISRSADTEEDAVEDEFSSRTHLGQGWYRITNVESGSVLFRGVQTLIESQNRFTFLTVYNPGRSGNRCQSVVFQFKLVPESENMLNIVLAYESAASYFVLSFDVLQKTISLYYVTGIPISFQVLCQQSSLIWQDSIDHKDINIVNHRFYKYQLQIDNSHLSVHLNGTSIYTKKDCETLIQFNLKTSTIPSFERSTDLSIGYFGFLLLPNQQIFLKEMELKSNLLGNVSSVPIPTATIIPKKPEKISASIPTVLTPIVPTETHKSASASLESGKLTNNLLIEFENKKTSNQSERLRQRLLDLKYDHNIIDTILQDIFTDQLNISFEDIAGLAEPKRMLNEAIILPFIMPEYFTGFCQPWKGILLFGPAGTGKTLLAKAVANLNHCTFFNCSTANLISKWRGDSEKLIKCLFEAARIAAPSILFFDEIDALVTSRGSDNEHEASRRMKNEIFSQMDGLQSNSSSTSDQPRVVVLATTNCPWDLDPAILRRLEKRVYIPLPDSQSRSQHFELCLRAMKLQYGECKTETSEEENKQALVKYLSNATDGYSGADIVLVCREAAMIPMRKLLSSHTVGEIQKRRSNGNLEIAAIAREDFDEALKKTKLSIQPEAVSQYDQWNQLYGSTG